MRTLTPTLLAAQRSASAVPYLRVVARDRIAGVRRLRFERIYDGVEADSFHAAAMPSDGSLLRARVDGGTLYYQRVAAPDAESEFSQWTALGDAADADVALCAEGSRVLLFYVDPDGVTLKVRESNDSGATLGSPVIAATASTSVAWLAAAVKPSGDVLLLYSAGATVYSARRTGGAWGSPAGWPHSVASVDGIACHHQGDWDVAVAGSDSGGDAFVWTAVYGDGFAQAPGTWSALREVTRASDGSGVGFRAPFLSQPDTYRLTFVETYAGDVSYARPQHSHTPPTTGFGANLWREPVPFDLDSAYGLAIAHDGDAVWLSTANGVWTSGAATPDADLTPDVLAATVEEEAFGGRARIVLRNDDGRYSPPQAPLGIGAEIRISPGYVTAGGPESSGGPAYWIEGIEQVTGGGTSTLLIEARGAWSLLGSWRARRQFSWPGGDTSVFGILRFLFARAGIDLSGAGTSDAASDRLPAFTVHPGESGLTAVKRLLATVPDVITVSGEFASLSEPLPADAADYEYGTSHPLLSGRYLTRAAETNRAQVFGDGVFAERFGWLSIEANYDRLAQAIDRNSTTVALAEDRAAAILRRSSIAALGGEIAVPVNCGQELYDAIEITDPAAGLVAARRRVLGIRLRYDTAKPVYEMRIVLGGM